LNEKWNQNTLAHQRKEEEEAEAQMKDVQMKLKRLKKRMKRALALLLGGGVLVLLVLGHEVVHVGLGLGELHLVHALTGVPVEEGLAAEHGGELLDTRLNISWMAVELPTKVAAILRPLGGMSQTEALTLLGIHSTK
jgi:hypothetical protein